MKTGKIEIDQSHLDEVLKNLPSLRLLLIMTHPSDKEKLFLVAEHDDFESNNSLFLDELPEYNILASKHPEGHKTNYRVEKSIERRVPTNGDIWELFASDLEKRFVVLIQYISDGEYVILKRSASCLNMVGEPFAQDELAQYLAESDGEFMGNCNDVSVFGI